MGKDNKLDTSAETGTTNKILIVGHPYSDFEKVENLLTLSGMKPASPLQKKAVSPSEISGTILDVEFAEEGSANRKVHKIKQLSEISAWNSLTSDFLESNEKQNFFVWSDTKAVSLLSYWEKLDPEIFFIFVYDSPENLLIKLLNEDINSSSDILKLELEQWLKYNKALLKFYKQHKDRSLFVSSRQIVSNSKIYLEQISKKTGINTLQFNTLLYEENDNHNLLEKNLLAHFGKQVLKEYPKVREIFDVIQSVANPPSTQYEHIKLSSMDLLREFNRFKTKKDEELQKLSSLFQMKERQLQRWLECKITEEERLEKVVEKSNDEHMKQIFEIQEDLEKNYLNREKVLQDFEKVSKEKDVLDKKEKMLRKWLECKIVEEARLEKSMDSQKKEK